jgi:hypothetical protein
MSLYGASIAIGGTFLYLGRRRQRAASRPLGDGAVGLAPPAALKRDKPAGYAFDPWTSEAEQKRLAKYFMDVRSKEAKALVPKILPEHIHPYAEFMVRQSERPVTGRDIVKAYLLTVGSMQRQAICPGKQAQGCKADSVGENPATGKARWENHPFQNRKSRIRPEDALGVLLQSPVGQRYLNAAEKGHYDSRAAETLARNFSGWGFQNRFAEQLREAPRLASDQKKIARILRKGTRPSWYRYVQKNIPGVSIAKAGFLASMLGRGDMATADARELQFWLCGKGNWDIEKRTCLFPISKSFDEVSSLTDEGFMKIFNARMKALKIQMPDRYKPFYAHLAHHALWDEVGRSKTTHGDIIEAMETA